MLKRLLLIWIFSGSLDSFSQVADATYELRNNYDGTWTWAPKPDTARILNKPDTLRAELLVTYTTRRWGIAHSRDGYVVKKGNEVEYLDNNHKPFPMCVTVWGWVKWEDRVKRRRK